MEHIQNVIGILDCAFYVKKGASDNMKIITIEKGTPYFQLETDLAAALNSRSGDLFLDKDNCLKHDTEICLIRKKN